VQTPTSVQTTEGATQTIAYILAMKPALRVLVSIALASLAAACVSSSDAGPDAGAFDAGVFDAGVSESGPPDASPFDASPPSESGTDAGGTDATGTDAATPPVIASFTATPGVIPATSTRTVTLAWSVQGATSLSISGIGAVTGTSTTTSVSATTKFTLTATSATGGVATMDATVTIDNGAVGTYIDAVNGSDTTGDGTPGKPFQTLAKVGTVAASGKTIYAFPGTYALQVTAVNVAAGVGIEAVNPGTVTFSGGSGSYGITFAGAGFLRGVKMDHAFVNVGAGLVAIDATQFTGLPDQGSANSAGINVSGTGHVVLTPGALTSYGDNTTASLGYLSGSGQLEVRGGALLTSAANVFSSVALFNVNDTSQLTLDNVKLDGLKTGAVLAQGSSTVTLQNGTLIHASAQASGPFRQAITVTGSPTVILDASSITATPGVGIAASANVTAPVVTLRNGATIDAATSLGVSFAGTGTLTLDNAHITNCGDSGVDLESGVLITKAGTVVSGNKVGINPRIGAMTSITLRGTQVINNVNDGLLGALAATSTTDLGTAASPGGNTFAGNGAANAAASNVNLSVSLAAADLTINAVGNTWDPNANGADATGHFGAGTTFSAPPTVSGKNVRLAQSGTATSHLLLVATP
jgi:Right handed beta helix region